MPKIDMGSVQEFEPVPEDIYDCVLSDWESGEGPNGSYYNLEFTIDSGEFEGRKLWLIRSLAPKSLPYFKKTARLLGASSEMLSGNLDTDDIMADITGNSCRLAVKNEEYEGEVRNRVTRVLATVAV